MLQGEEAALVVVAGCNDGGMKLLLESDDAVGASSKPH